MGFLKLLIGYSSLPHVAGDKYFKKNIYSFLRKIKFTKIKKYEGLSELGAPSVVKWHHHAGIVQQLPSAYESPEQLSRG